MPNPFNPSFGKRPVHFYGRQDTTRTIVSSVGDLNDPWRTTLITGVRGSGKTALLSDIRMNLRGEDVIALYVVPNEAMLDSVLVGLYRQLPKTVPGALPELKSISFNPGVAVSFEKNTKLPYFTGTFSFQIMEMMDFCMKHGKHIVFLIDEAQKHTGDMRVFISTYQDLIMREYSVSMVLAGLPSVVSDILNDDVLTFLRRAKQIDLENIELMTVGHEFRKTFLGADSTLTDEVVSRAAACTCGYPYLIQLVGYYLWEEMTANSGRDTQSGACPDVLEEVLFKSKAELFRNVHKLVFANLSNKDREFVFAMSEDDEASSVSAIGDRMQEKKNCISLYRDRLISTGVVKPCGHGLLCFNYPYMKEFLSYKKQELL